MQASPIRTTLFVMLADLLMLFSLLAFSFLLRSILGGNISFDVLTYLLCSLLLAIPVYGALGLYPPILMTSQDTLRLLTYGTSIVFLIMITFTFFMRTATDYSRFALLLAWLLAIIIMPIWRGVIKRKFSKKSWWGNSIILCGSYDWLQQTVWRLHNNSNTGLKPCAVVLLDEASQSKSNAEITLSFELASNAPQDKKQQATPLSMSSSSPSTITLPNYNLDALPEFADYFNYPYAFMNLHNLDSYSRVSMAKLSRHFKKTFFISSFLGHLNCWSGITDIGGSLVLETRQKLLDIRRQHIKRLIDLILTILGAIVFIPATLFIATVIKLEDGGPIFYAHTRIGKGGRKIKVLKFRTMVKNADKVLEKYLAKDYELAKEWAENHKLKNDPRITRAGRWLRKTSLDELPQVWNVLKGELSFVGPRPIVQAEIEKYGPTGYELYASVLPGLTGFWQISGRSDTSYDQRVELDSYYIRNWSIWLDIYIIACTPRALLKPGAY